MSEEQIIEGCRKGDRQARRELYERYSKRFFGIVCRYIGDREQAEDVLHDAFVSIYSKIGDYRGSGSFEGWCCRILVNKSLSSLRRTSALKMASFDDAKAVAVDTESFNNLSTADIFAAISRLPDGYRAVLNLFAIDGFSHEEIGRMLGISSATSRTQLLRARQRLAEILQQEYGMERETTADGTTRFVV